MPAMIRKTMNNKKTAMNEATHERKKKENESGFFPKTMSISVANLSCHDFDQRSKSKFLSAYESSSLNRVRATACVATKIDATESAAHADNSR